MGIAAHIANPTRGFVLLPGAPGRFPIKLLVDEDGGRYGNRTRLDRRQHLAGPSDAPYRSGSSKDRIAIFPLLHSVDQ